MKQIEEVRSDYTSEDQNLTHIDVWFKNADQGHSVAVVDMDTDKVIYLDSEFIGNKLVQEEIDKVLWKELTKLKKVTLTVVVRDINDANILAKEMVDTYIAGEGLYTLVCGDIRSLTTQEEELMADQLDNDIYYDLLAQEHEK